MFLLFQKFALSLTLALGASASPAHKPTIAPNSAKLAAETLRRAQEQTSKIGGKGASLTQNVHFVMLGTSNTQEARARFKTYLTGEDLPPSVTLEARNDPSNINSDQPLLVRENKRAWMSAGMRSSGWTVVIDNADAFTWALSHGGAKTLRSVLNRFKARPEDPLFILAPHCPGRHIVPTPEEVMAYAVTTNAADILLQNFPPRGSVWDGLKALVKRGRLRMVCVPLHNPQRETLRIKYEQLQALERKRQAQEHAREVQELQEKSTRKAMQLKHSSKLQEGIHPSGEATPDFQFMPFMTPGDKPPVMDFADFFDGWQNILASAVMGSVMTCGLCALYISCQSEDQNFSVILKNWKANQMGETAASPSHAAPAHVTAHAYRTDEEQQEILEAAAKHGLLAAAIAAHGRHLRKPDNAKAPEEKNTSSTSSPVSLSRNPDTLAEPESNSIGDVNNAVQSAGRRTAPGHCRGAGIRGDYLIDWVHRESQEQNASGAAMDQSTVEQHVRCTYDSSVDKVHGYEPDTRLQKESARIAHEALMHQGPWQAKAFAASSEVPHPETSA